MIIRPFIFFSAMIAAFGGFLLGFDIGILTGINLPFSKLWLLGGFKDSLIYGFSFYGTLVGAFLGFIPADFFGRKKTLLGIGILFLISTIGTAVSPEGYSFLLFRFISGLGVGLCLVVIPVYLAEISPASTRGRLMVMFPVNIVMGLILALKVPDFLVDTGTNAWRMALGAGAIPALVYLFLVSFVIKSPRWLVQKTQSLEEARQILSHIEGKHLSGLLSSLNEGLRLLTPRQAGNLFSPAYSHVVLLAILMIFFNQLAGSIVVMSYAPSIFEASAAVKDNFLFSPAGMSFYYLLFLFVGMGIIDLFGRRALMMVGSFGLITTLSLMSWAFYTEFYEGGILIFFVYLAFYALSHGVVVWVFIPEVFPSAVRAKGQSLMIGILLLLASAIATVSTSSASSLFRGSLFLFFMLVMLGQVLWVWKRMCETRDKTLEELEGQSQIFTPE